MGDVKSDSLARIVLELDETCSIDSSYRLSVGEFVMFSHDVQLL